VKHTAQKDEMEMKMVKIVTNGINKILKDKIQEVDKAYDPACQKLSVQADTISNYLQKVEKSLQRTNDVLENSKLEESGCQRRKLSMMIFKCCKMKDLKI
jgi:uncharacterized protein YaaN involved in tellurite resistance